MSGTENHTSLISFVIAGSTPASPIMKKFIIKDKKSNRYYSNILRSYGDSIIVLDKNPTILNLKTARMILREHYKYWDKFYKCYLYRKYEIKYVQNT